MSLVLMSGPLRLDIDPLIGGCVRALDWHGISILRPAPDKDDAQPLETGAFPMIPFNGRIANARFNYNGRNYQLEPNFAPEPHAIHGYGWQSKWQIAACDATTARLRHVSDGEQWPWAYEAYQLFQIGPAEVRLTLVLTNKSEAPMPAGIGWHPYFPREDAQIQADTHTVWLCDEDMIPAPPVLVTPHFDLTRTRPVSLLNMDHIFGVGSTVQHLSWPDRIVTLSSDPVFSKLVVYVPPGEDYFCVEPISHAPNALNSTLPTEQTGLIVLQPGQTLSGTIRINLQAF